MQTSLVVEILVGLQAPPLTTLLPVGVIKLAKFFPQILLLDTLTPPKTCVWDTIRVKRGLVQAYIKISNIVRFTYTDYSTKNVFQLI